MAWYNYERFPTSTPREAKGGIKAQTQRGAFGQSWWAKRWIAVLESFNIGARLNRGRSYARSGQVLSIDIHTGKVKAKVQGSRPTPYAVTVEVAPLSAADREKFIQALSSQVLFTAKLLAGEMPEDIEQVFTEAGLSLFPKRSSDLQTACSCPDWSNPCKHVAAVYYLLGEEFDRDPFLLFKLRGIDRKELLSRLGAAPATTTPEASTGKPKKTPVAPTPVAAPPEPLAVDPAPFWQGVAVPDDLLGAAQLPPVPAALPKRLGGFPFWRGQQPLQTALEARYTAAAQRGLDVLGGGE